MTYCDVSQCDLAGSITCPPSKSYTHRAIFLASLADTGGSTITNVLCSADTDATIGACKKMGAKITASPAGDTLTVTGTIMQAHAAQGTDTGYGGILIDALNSGTTIRIAAGIAALLDTRVTLTGDQSLRKRPMQPLLDALNAMGASCSSEGNDGCPPLSVRGPVSGGSITIPGNVSSQFVTSLFLCAPRTESGIEIAIRDEMVSKPYLDATIGAMREFGVSVQTQVPYKRYRVTPQRITHAGRFVVPSDASSLALLLAASALNGGSITINAHMGTLPQGDEAFIDMLEAMGAIIEISDAAVMDGSGKPKDTDAAKKDTAGVLGAGETIRVRVGSMGLGGGRFDLGNYPDLLPPLAIMALRCSEPIEIFNVGHARLKETDRIAILARELPKLGICVQEETRDGLTICGAAGGACKDAGTHSKSQGMQQDAPESMAINVENDHRLFMALCIAATRVGRCKISDPDSVRVSYPGFINDLKMLGAAITIA